jgi:siroheme synthase-like protein
VSGFPVLLDGPSLTALVVGGGLVATRKVRALLDVGAHVRVVAPRVTEGLDALANGAANLVIERRRFRTGDVQRADLVFAATDDRAVNARVARTARDMHRLVSVVDAPSEGTFSGMAVHRSGDVVIGVSAGGVPRAAAHVRDAIAERFDARYAEAIAALRSIRRRLLSASDRAGWRAAMASLVDARFCARVESGAFAAEADAWR